MEMHYAYARCVSQLHFGERVRPSHSTERVLLNEHGPFAHLHGPFAHLIKERMENPVIGMHQKPQAESCTGHKVLHCPGTHGMLGVCQPIGAKAPRRQGLFSLASAFDFTHAGGMSTYRRQCDWTAMQPSWSFIMVIHCRDF